MDFIEYVKVEIRNKLNEITDNVINGDCLTFDNYRYMCGQAFGLIIVEDIIKQAERKMLQADGEESDPE